MRNRLVTILSLVVFCLIIILPPIIHGYIYPNIGDDTAAHMNILDWVGWFAPEKTGDPVPTIRYAALYIIGYPLDVVSHIFNADKDTLFMWFNFLALMTMGITLFFIFKNLMGLYTGLLALIVPIFTSYGILLLFYSGVIFEIINIGIILPLACFCAVQYIVTKRKRFAIAAGCLSLLFAVFHSTGIYLPMIITVGFVVFVYYKYRAEKDKRQSVWGYLLIIMGVSFCLALFLVFNPILGNIYETMAVPSTGISGLPLLQKSLLYYMSSYMLVILVISSAMLVWEHEQLLFVEKLTIGVFGGLAVIMLPAILFGWSPQPFRQGIAFAIFLSLLAVVLVGALIRIDKQRMATFVVVGLVIGGATLNAVNWFGYNSALEKVDIEAIQYINSLPGEYYSCSDNVDPWIYSRYVDKNYLLTKGAILVVRNVPMKSKVVLVEEGDLTSGRVFVNGFEDDGVEIEIYK